MSKICKGECGKEKPYSEFFKEKKGSDGYRSKCKVCHTKQAFESSRKKPESYLNRMWNVMNGRVKGTGDAKQRRLYKGLEICTKEEFINKFIISKNFLNLHKKYIESEFDEKLAPSPDRIKSSFGYQLGNIRIMTWGENRQLSPRNKKNVLL